MKVASPLGGSISHELELLLGEEGHGAIDGYSEEILFIGT